MKHTLTILSLILSLGANAQTIFSSLETKKQGEFYIHWGWNREWFTKSDIHFTGTNYDFTLNDVIALDKPAKFDPNIYFNPRNITIPQYNFRVGYFIKDKYHLSLGMDHMKYVVQQGQTVTIDGKINEPNNPYNGNYAKDEIKIQPGFLEMEHTDGLNYYNVEFGRFDNVFQYKKLTIGLSEALGVGVMNPRTDAHLFQNERHDEFHLAGFGVNTQLGVNFTFFDHFYIKSEVRGGYIHMPDIRTTYSLADKAKQDIYYFQCNVLFGAFFRLVKP